MTSHKNKALQKNSIGSFFFFTASASPGFHRMAARAYLLSYYTAPFLCSQLIFIAGYLSIT